MSVNTLIDGDYLQFTASIWNVDEISSKISNKIESIGNNAFPYIFRYEIFLEQQA